MKGTINIRVRNKRVDYKLTLRRNITFVQGDSGTGKTTLFEMVSEYARLGSASGVQLTCKKKCVPLTDFDWLNQLANTHDSIVFIDEGCAFAQKKEFAEVVNHSDNYFIFFMREPLHQLSYSINEIYAMKVSGKLHTLTPLYKARRNFTYGAPSSRGKTFTLLMTEDSNAGFEFYKKRFEGTEIRCVSAGSKSKIHELLSSSEGTVFVIADGAAFGDEANRVFALQEQNSDKITICLPESFEWLLLKSGLIKSDGLQEILNNPSDHIESSEFPSWERYFTHLLIEMSQNGPFVYQKGKLNEAYAIPANADKVMKLITNGNVR